MHGARDAENTAWILKMHDESTDKQSLCCAYPLLGLEGHVLDTRVMNEPCRVQFQSRGAGADEEVEGRVCAGKLHVDQGRRENKS